MRRGKEIQQRRWKR